MNLSTHGLCLAADAAVDLHLHTTASDGRWTAEGLLGHLRGEQFGLAAITDHDRADGETLAAIQRLALDSHLPLLVGVEMSSTWQGELVDLLCYGFEPSLNALDDLAQDLLRRQQENTREVFENLRRQGYALPAEALAGIVAQPGVQQPHALAALLKEHGYGQAGSLANAVGLGGPSAGKILLGAGCKLAFNDPAAVVEAAHRCGAVCLLAHPGRGDGFVTFDAPLLDEFRQVAPVDGLEVYYPLHAPGQVEMFREYARRNRLLASAGSDSHGPEKPPIRYRAEVCRELLEQMGVRVG